MNKLANRDLNQFRLDIHSWLGRAALAGVESEKLPDNFSAALMAFLRIHSLRFAQKQRTGIALGRDALRRGVGMGLSCIDLALEEQSAADLNRAVEVLAAGEFAKLYKRGWEMALARLESMRERAERLSKRRHLAFFGQVRDRIAALAHLVPETWTSVDLEGKLIEIDLRTDWDLLAAVEGRVEFLCALPEEAFAELWAKRGIDFTQVLWRIVLALALARRDLSVDAEVVRAFESACFADGILLPVTRAAVLEQVAMQLQERSVETGIAREIEREIEREIMALERAAAAGFLPSLFLQMAESKEAEWGGREDAAKATRMDWGGG